MNKKFKLLIIGLTLSTGLMAQVTTNSGSGLAASYPTLADAITALNAATINAPVVITLNANETAPSGGYVITASGTSENTIVIQGGGNTVTASGSQVAGSLTDAIFKIIGADYVTIENFVMVENSANTNNSIANPNLTNNMTEWGVAVLYATTTNGAQNITIQNNTITLNAAYSNTFGIYSNSTHSSTVVGTAATATGDFGANHNLKIYGNTISEVKIGIVSIGPDPANAHQTGLDIGGSSALTGNTIREYGAAGGNFFNNATFNGTNGVNIRNTKGFNVSYNSISTKAGTVVATYNAVMVQSCTNAPTGTFTNKMNNNTIDIFSAGVSTNNAVGISIAIGTSNATSEIQVNNNNFTRLTFNTASNNLSVTISAILLQSSAGIRKINNNTLTNIETSIGSTFNFISLGNTPALANSTTEIKDNSIVGTFTKTGRAAFGAFYGVNIQTSTSPSTAVWTISGNNFSNVSMNCVSNDGNPFYGINHNDGGQKTIANNTINNIALGPCQFQNTIFGIFVANSHNGLVVNNTITNCTTGGAFRGIDNSAAGASSVDIFRGNTIGGFRHNGTPTSNFAINGIEIGGGASKTIEKNKIFDMASLSGGASRTNGISIVSVTNVTINNNAIGNLHAANSTQLNAVQGIVLSSGITTASVNYNSIYLNTSPTNNPTPTSYGTIALSVDQNTNITLRNNILVNKSTSVGFGRTVAYQRASSVNLSNHNAASNNNLYYVGTPSSSNVVFLNGAGTTPFSTLAAFQTLLADSRESNSIYEEPIFLNTSSGNNFLRIDPTNNNNIIGGAIPVAGITDDIDGKLRDILTPTIGAYEGGVPDAPINLVATAGNGLVVISFTPGADGGSPITNYEYTLDGGVTWIALNPANNSSPITIPNLTNGTTYTIQLRAVNGVGAGAASTSVTATPVFSVLPVTLTRFHVSKHGTVAKLDWSTAFEQNNKGFQIQRSSNGLNFTNIGFVAARGNGSGADYTFTDAAPLNGRNFYRLQQEDEDGKRSLSAVRTLDFRNGMTVSVYPNPVQQQLTLTQVSTTGLLELQLTDLQGRPLRQWKYTNPAPVLQLNLGHLPAGMYLLNLKDAMGGVQTMQVMKQ